MVTTFFLTCITSSVVTALVMRMCQKWLSSRQTHQQQNGEQDGQGDVYETIDGHEQHASVVVDHEQREVAMKNLKDNLAYISRL